MFGIKNLKNILYIKNSLLRFQSNEACSIYIEEVNDHIKRIVLNNRKHVNSLSLSFMRELENKLTEIEDKYNSNLRVLIIKSSGKIFSCGHDLRELYEADKSKSHQIFNKASYLMKMIENYFVPVIMSINGPVVAAGCQLIASCDIAICGKSSSFSTPGVLSGIMCSTPAVDISRILPRKIALEMIYTGRVLSAEDAFRYGFVNHLIEDDEVDNMSEKIAYKIASLSNPVIKLGKKCFNEQIQMDKEEANKHASEVMVQNLQLTDCKEGIKAFFEKRKPIWNHK